MGHMLIEDLSPTSVEPLQLVLAGKHFKINDVGNVPPCNGIK